MTNPIPTHRPVDVELDLEWLEKIAREAESEAPWNNADGVIWVESCEVAGTHAHCCGAVTRSGECCGQPQFEDEWVRTQEQIGQASGGNAEFIATFDPPTVLSLLSTIRGLEEEVRAAQSQPIVSPHGHPEAGVSAAGENCPCFDPSEGLPGELMEVYTECSNGSPINGADLEVVERAAYRLRAVEARVRDLLDALRPFAQFAEDNTEADGDSGNGVWAGNRCESDRIRDWFGPTEFLRAALAAAHPAKNGASVLAPKGTEGTLPPDALPPPTKSDEPHSGGGEDPPLRFNMQGRHMTHCQSDDDGYCDWTHCPQLRDNEPATSRRHCPLDMIGDEE